MRLADTNFPSEKNFEVENFRLLTMIFSENFLSVENFLERKWALTNIEGGEWGQVLQVTYGQFHSVFVWGCRGRFARFGGQHRKCWHL
jgi:hypothetical protein